MRAATAALLGYSWPGNIRELRNVIELVCLLREGKPVRLPDLPAAIRREVERADPSPRHAAAQGEEFSVRLDRPLDETITTILQAALALEDGNRSRAARRLGLSLRTMQRFVARGARTVRTMTRG